MKAIVRRAGLASALGLSLALGACETPQPPAPPPAYPPLPAVALDSSIAEAAAIYLGYVTDTATISATFADGGQVRQSMLRAAAYEPAQLSRGMVAYAAIIALQSPEFVNGVRSLAQEGTNRDTLLRQIIANPAYVATLPGADQAAGLIASQIGQQGATMYAAGAAVKQTAYDIQRQRWSTQHITDRESRLEQVRVLGITPLAPNYAASAQLQQAALSGQSLGLPPAIGNRPYSQAVTRGLALAAVAALGQAGDSNRAITEALLNEPTSADCMNFTRLMILQCLAASRPQYEEIFCLGQHLIMDTAQCVTDAAGTATFGPMSIADQSGTGDTSAQTTSPDAQTPN